MKITRVLKLFEPPLPAQKGNLDFKVLRSKMLLQRNVRPTTCSQKKPPKFFLGGGRGVEFLKATYLAPLQSRDWGAHGKEEGRGSKVREEPARRGTGEGGLLASNGRMLVCARGGERERRAYGREGGGRECSVC